MKRSLILASVLAVLCTPAVYASDDEASCEISIIEQHDYSTRLVEKIKMQRDVIYNSLNLTPKQIKCKDEIETKRYIELEPELKNFCIYKKKLKDAEAANNAEAVKQAEKQLKCVRKNIQKISSKYDKEFMKILDSNQRAKYRMIRKLKRNDLKKYQKVQKNGSKPSDVKPFGCKMSQAEYTEKLKEQNSFWNKFKRNKNKNDN